MGLSFTNSCWPSPAKLFSCSSPAGFIAIFCLRFETPQPGGPGTRIYIPQEQGGPVIPPGTGFLFRLFLRLAGLRCKYSNPPPHGRGGANRKHRFHHHSSTIPRLLLAHSLPREPVYRVVTQQ
jgi:hypothetical protein